MVEYGITSRVYIEHNCNRPHKSVEVQLRCFLKEGFSTKQKYFGKKQPSVCLFRGEGSWAVVHARDVRSSKELKKPHTEYAIDLFEDFDEAGEYWMDARAHHGKDEKCVSQCAGLYPHIMAAVLGWPYRVKNLSRGKAVWPTTFVKNLFIYERDTGARKL